MAEWRDIWKELIVSSGKDLISKDSSLKNMKVIEEKYPGDKMILFEEAIAYECLNKFENAKKLYEMASDEQIGLPVKHWRKRAKYFLDRLETRKSCNMSADLNPSGDIDSIQWDTYFNIHSYCYLDGYVRYLAISSVSRIVSEPAMAIVIFRTCLEICLWTYYEKEAERINKSYKANKKTKNDIGLDDLIDELKKENSISKSEHYIFNSVRLDGNSAAHPKKLSEGIPFHYENSELIKVLENFNKMLDFFDRKACKLYE